MIAADYDWERATALRRVLVLEKAAMQSVLRCSGYLIVPEAMAHVNGYSNMIARLLLALWCLCDTPSHTTVRPG